MNRGALWLLCVLLGSSAAAAPPSHLPAAADLARLAPPVRATIEDAVASYRNLPTAATAATRADTLESLAQVLHAHDQAEMAGSAYEAVLALDPERFSTVYLRALLKLGLGDNNDALAGFQKAIALRPDYAAAHLRLAELQLGLGQLDAAEISFHAALEHQPDSAAAYAGLGRAALQRGDSEAALVSLQRALQLQPQAGRLRTALALALRGLGRVDEARQVLTERNDQPIWVADPLLESLAGLRRNPAVLFEQGRELARQGQLEAAIKVLDETVALAPQDPIYLTELGSVLLQSGQLDRSDAILDQAVKIDPDSGLVAELRARVALARGDQNTAAERLSEALARLPDADDLRVELARLYFRRGAYAEAASQLDELARRVEGAELDYALYWGGLAHAMAPACAPALERLQTVFTKSGGRDGWAMLGLSRLRALCTVPPAEREEGRRWAETMFSQHPGPDTAVSLAMHEAAAGRFDQAVLLQSQALQQARSNQQPAGLLAAFERDLAGYRDRKLPDRAYQPGSDLLGID